MKILLKITSLLCFTIHAYAFDDSWIEKNVHDDCTLMESKSFISNSEEWNTEANAYGEAIGATNAIVNSDHSVPDGWQYNVSYYACPENCTKNGASEDNGMQGKESLLKLIGYGPIECSESLIVSDFLLFDFDHDGINGYAFRYKTTHGGNQGQNGWLHWDVAFIKNTNGKLYNLRIKNPGFTSETLEFYYHKIVVFQEDIIVQYYTIKEDNEYKIINIRYQLEGEELIPSGYVP